jgi:hypothetical protein
MTASGKGNEAFYTDERGQKADADIHWPILDAVDDTEFRKESFMRAVKAGIPPDAAARMYALDLADLSDPPPAESARLATDT